jgi:hypothetical protein
MPIFHAEGEGELCQITTYLELVEVIISYLDTGTNNFAALMRERG